MQHLFGQRDSRAVFAKAYRGGNGDAFGNIQRQRQTARLRDVVEEIADRGEPTTTDAAEAVDDGEAAFTLEQRQHQLAGPVGALEHLIARELFESTGQRFVQREVGHGQLLSGDEVEDSFAVEVGRRCL